MKMHSFTRIKEKKGKEGTKKEGGGGDFDVWCNMARGEGDWEDGCFVRIQVVFYRECIFFNQ